MHDAQDYRSWFSPINKPFSIPRDDGTVLCSPDYFSPPTRKKKKWAGYERLWGIPVGEYTAMYLTYNEHFSMSTATQMDYQLPLPIKLLLCRPHAQNQHGCTKWLQSIH